MVLESLCLDACALAGLAPLRALPGLRMVTLRACSALPHGGGPTADDELVARDVAALRAERGVYVFFD